MSAIERAIDSLMPGEPITHLNLSIYPLFGFVTTEPDYLTLDEGRPRPVAAESMGDRLVHLCAFRRGVM